MDAPSSEDRALTGRVAVVTGANSGLGLATAEALVRRGATVIAACRHPERAAAAVTRLRAVADHGGDAVHVPLDLASLASVEAFAQALAGRFDRVDLLVNNAGVMMPKRRTATADGFELQFGTNHLGHFALTLRLVPLLAAARAPRVVTVSSLAHRAGRLDFDDLQAERRYRRFRSYGTSKLANLLFSRELGRRAAACGLDLISAAAHPGYTATNLQDTVLAFKLFNPVAGQRPARGALPTLYAATAPDVRSGDFFGPRGLFQLRGAPKRVGASAAGRDPALAARLWEVSEALTSLSLR